MSRPLKRPYATRYFDSAPTPGLTPVSWGSCASENGAIRAAVPRLFLGQFAGALVLDRVSGDPLYRIYRQGQGLRIEYADGVGFKTYTGGR